MVLKGLEKAGQDQVMGVSKTKAWANFQKSPFYVLPYHFMFTSVKPFHRQFWGLFSSELD